MRWFSPSLGAGLPWGDWEFWAVTAAAAACAVWLMRGVIGRRVFGRGSAARTKVTLTIEGRSKR